MSSWIFGSHYRLVHTPASPETFDALPKLFVIGDRDDFSSTHQIGSFVAKVKNASLTFIPNASHFYDFGDQKNSLGNAIIQWIDSNILP